MFKNPFSFEGRIRRTEYGISVIITVFINFIFSAIGGAMGEAGFIMLFLMIPVWIFNLAQSVKRSHDIGNTGWYVLIPFYGLWLLFADGERGTNRYGKDPKERDYNQVGYNNNTISNSGEYNANSINYNGGHNANSSTNYNGTSSHSAPNQQYNNQQNRTGFNGGNPYTKN